MIKHCLSAVSIEGARGRGVPNLVMALLIAGAAQSYAQILPAHGQRDTAAQPQACSATGAGLQSAACRAASNPGQSKYNLLYADDVADDVPAGESERTSGPVSASPCRSCPTEAQSGRQAGRMPDSAARNSRSESAGTTPTSTL
ncbi:hypothetical protein [Cupriavidus sp. UYPR2.512]|uniref:hypothetical protein n=1 Tax=Cupriavidus sp. UYPR2.512 TaxID=1080187 RepID=UPI000378799F|nr:hypothetical protein [Cupriavidus sp. UYPR2.512]UIF89720.1 hypothetical protein KAF44_38640 [Cupriavidus necator]